MAKPKYDYFAYGVLKKMAKRMYVDPLWHVLVAVIVSLVLQVLLPPHLVYGPRYLVPIAEVVLLVGLSVSTPMEYASHSQVRRIVAITLIGITSLANATSLFLLVGFLTGGGRAEGRELITASLNIFVTNIITFGLLYWEMDAGGPSARHMEDPNMPDFLFPQMDVKEVMPPQWIPTFVDYLYLSATNATAFSPTDTLPLTHRAKMLMLSQSLVSLVTVALVTARAVNILS